MEKEFQLGTASVHFCHHLGGQLQPYILYYRVFQLEISHNACGEFKPCQTPCSQRVQLQYEALCRTT